MKKNHATQYIRQHSRLVEALDELNRIIYDEGGIDEKVRRELFVVLDGWEKRLCEEIC